MKHVRVPPGGSHCAVAAQQRHGKPGFRALVWTGPGQPWHGPFRQEYADAVADAEGHAKDAARRYLASRVAH